MVCGITCIVTDISAQSGIWTWLHGDSTSNTAGIFGTQGVPSPTNTPPALYEPASWRGLDGRFWLFGGTQTNATNDCYSALWSYDATTNQWVWVKGPSTTKQPGIYGTKGVPSPANNPGARAWGAASWTDHDGNLWLFGGFGFDSAGVGTYWLNDLWRYKPLTNEWTWMSGSKLHSDTGSYTQKGVPNPIDRPSARIEFNATWVDDDNNLWLFGGLSLIGQVDDLWKYDISTGMWTWVAGGNAITPPIHGTKGVPSPSNTPGSRACYSTWRNDEGDLMLFGGWAVGVPITAFSDTWKFDMDLGQWVWIAGPSSTGDSAVSGDLCEPGIEFHPAARYENRSTVIDTNGNVLMFGGFTSAPVRNMNDLWRYNSETNEWTWIAGSHVPNQSSVFGTKGVPDAANAPGSRGGSVAWLDDHNNFWLFGGMAYFGLTADFNNELWMFTYDPSCSFDVAADITNASCNDACDGSISLITTGGVTPFTFAWTNGEITAAVTDLCAGNYSVTVTDSTGNVVVKIFSISQPAPLEVIVFSDTTIKSGQSAQLKVTPAGNFAYQWSPPTDISCTTCPNPVATPSATTTYTVVVTDTNGCNGMDEVTITVVENALVVVPNAFSPNGDLINDDLFAYVLGSAELIEFNIYNRWGQVVFTTNVVESERSLGWDGTFRGSDQPMGCYAYVVRAVVESEEVVMSGNITLLR